MKREDRTPIHVSISAHALSYTSRGDLEAIEGTIENITARRWVEETSRRLAAIVESSQDAIIVKTLDGIITSWNRGAQRLYGHSAEEAVGCHISMLVPPERPEEIPGILRRLRRGMKIEHYETVRVTKDGRYLDISLSVFPIEDAEGNVVSALTIAHDITEYKHIEEELRRSEKRFGAIFEQAAVGMAQVGLDGRWLRINRKLCEIVGYSREELLRKTFLDMTHPEDLDKDLDQMGRLLEGEIQTYSLEKRYLRKDSSAVWTNSTLTLMRGLSEEPDYFVSVIEDITERKRTEDAMEEVREAERTRIARDLHDGPLQDIAYALKEAEIVQLISENEGLRGRAGHVIETLTRAGRELRSAVYDLRQEEVQDKPLPRLLESLVELNQAMVPDREIELEIGEDLPAMTSSAAVDLLRIFQEALTNVRRHSGAGRVRVALCAAGEELVAEVSDDGHGFTSGMVSGVGTNSMRERAAGVDGEITVESEPGNGTRVQLRAPLSAVSALGRKAEVGDVASRYSHREGPAGP